eukprot:GDKH01021906.1.p1 GENE.GDKH01021906.1~~GDKH01021906.1.p1  ORF type:complete len:110 (+),score=4.57 GDKH01021906.1:115-444(+)
MLRCVVLMLVLACVGAISRLKGLPQEPSDAPQTNRPACVYQNMEPHCRFRRLGDRCSFYRKGMSYDGHCMGRTIGGQSKCFCEDDPRDFPKACEKDLESEECLNALLRW